MNYIATVVQSTSLDTYSRSFKNMSDAMRWLDEHNPGGELTTIIDVYDANWQKQEGFFYTKEKE